MRRRAVLAWVLAAAGACKEGAAPAPRIPAALEVVSAPSASVIAGASAGAFTVRVVDASAAPLRGVVVFFRVTQGAGRVNPPIDTTDATGTATATFTASTVAGVNEVSAAAAGLASVRFTVTGNVGPSKALSLTSRDIRLQASQDSTAISVVARDALGNATGEAVAWMARDSSLVSVASVASRASSGATVRVLRRPGQTWVIGTAGDARDSVRVTVHDTTSSPCDMLATPTALPVGGTVAVLNGFACVSSTSPGAEYVVVLHHNTVVSGVSATVEVTATGITSPQTPFPAIVSGPTSGPVADLVFERSLREREAREVSLRTDGARAWYRTRAPGPAGQFALSANVQVGDVVNLNVNAFDFCSNPKRRPARVVAVTQSAVVLADTSNPAGGFTEEEYRSFGVALDTLVHPVVAGAFGEPTDVDGNNRVGILFTGAVNELSQSGANSVILGFYYLRDLLPVRDPLGDCAGSNAAEMFYLLVPDPDGRINANPRSKDFVRSLVVGTIAHEYQHLINASRRMYVTNAPRVDEEPWLNEGLSHVAEELVFYHAAGLAPRGNIGATTLAAGTSARAAFDLYQRNNLARYREYLRAPNVNAPLAQSDALGVRGASWSFLRYAADRVGSLDGDLWKRLVNSTLTGVSNLQAALGGASGPEVLPVLSDWSVSVLVDDTPAASSAAFQQPSWDFVSAIPLVLPSFGLVPRVLNNGAPVTTSVIGGGNAYLRFGVPGGKEALVSARTPAGNPVAQAMRLTIVRIK